MGLFDELATESNVAKETKEVAAPSENQFRTVAKQDKSVAESFPKTDFNLVKTGANIAERINDLSSQDYNDNFKSKSEKIKTDIIDEAKNQQTNPSYINYFNMEGKRDNNINPSEQFLNDISNNLAEVENRKETGFKLEQEIPNKLSEIQSKKDSVSKEIKNFPFNPDDFKTGETISLRRDKFSSLNENLSNYSLAEDYLKETNEILKAPKKGTGSGAGNFFTGTGNTFSDKDFWTMGITELADNLQVMFIAKKLDAVNGDFSKLTDSENTVLDALAQKSAAEYARAFDTSNAYKGGQGAAESLGFMAQMFATGGVTKGTTKAAQIALLKALESKIPSILKAGISRTIAKAGTSIATGIPRAYAMGAMQPGTYAGAVEGTYDSNNIFNEDKEGNIKFGEFGDRRFVGSLLEQLNRSAIETGTELSGGFIGNGLRFAKDVSPALRNAMKTVSNTKIGKLADSFNNTSIGKAAKQAGYSGFLGEFEEEFDGALLSSLAGYDNLGDFFQADNLTTTMVTLAPMSLIGIGGQVVGHQKIRYDYKKSDSKINDYLKGKGLSLEQADNIKDLLLNSTPSDMYANMYKIANVIGATDERGFVKKEAYEPMLNYVVSASRRAAFDKDLSAKINQERELKSEISKQVDNASHEDGNIYAATKQDGSQVNITKGQVSVDNEGKVDSKSSDEYVIVKDENGKASMISPKEIQKIDSSQPSQELKEQTIKQAEQEFSDEVTMNFGGQNVIGIVQNQNTPDGNIIVQFDDEVDINGESATSIELTPEEFEQYKINGVQENQPTEQMASLNQPLQEVAQEQNTQAEQITPDVQAEQTVEYPRDKENNIDYSQIEDPTVYANGLKEEFGEEAITTIDELIAEQEEKLQKVKGNAIERKRTTNKINAELNKLNQVKSVLSPVVEQPIQTETQNNSAMVDNVIPIPEVKADVDEQPIENTIPTSEEVAQNAVEEVQQEQPIQEVSEQSLDVVPNEVNNSENTIDNSEKNVIFDRPKMSEEEILNNQHDSIVTLVEAYNKTPNNHTTKKRDIFNQIRKKSIPFGYTVNQIDNNKIEVLHEGKKIKRTSNKVSKEDIQSHKTLAEYQEDFQEFVTLLLDHGGLSNQMFDIGSNGVQATKNISEGKRTVLANNALDELERMFNNKVIETKGNAYYPPTRIPLDEFIALYEEPSDQQDERDTYIIPEDVAIKILEDQVLTDEETEQLNNIISESVEQYKTKQEDGTNRSTEEGISQKNPHNEGIEQAPGEVRSQEEGLKTPQSIEISKLEAEKQQLKAERNILSKEIIDRNGLFGDTKSNPNDLFSGQVSIDTQAGNTKLDEISNRIDEINRKVAELKKNESIGLEEAKGQQTIPESNIPTWHEAFKKAKETNDLEAIDILYHKTNVALNGLAQSKGEETVNEFKEFKKEIERYAEDWKNKQSIPKVEKETPTEKIEDFGEKIEGAKKDQVKKYYNKINLNGLTLSTIFPKPNIKELLESGLSIKEASSIKVAYEFASTSKKRYGKNKEKLTGSIKFMAAYAKSVLGENLNIEFDNEGWVFTDYGKQQINLRVSAYEKVAKELGNDYLDLDLSKVQIQELNPEYNKRFVNKPLDTEKYEVKYYVSKAKRVGSLEEALSEFVTQVKENTKTDVVDYKRKLAVYSDRYNRSNLYIAYNPKGKPIIKLKEGFSTAREAFEYQKNNEAELQEMLERILVASKDENKRTVTRLKYTNETARERVGKDWREGKNINSEDLATKFGFRGIEYGNWVNQKERQVFLNNTYDSFMDLSQILGISPKAISLNGKLAISFGSRGSGGASAHYEPDRVIINLTKTKGLGSLAHEWFHAVDNYFTDFKVTATGMQTTTSGQFKDGVRPELKESLKEVYDSFPYEFKQRSRMLDMNKSKNYFGLPHELAARAFENYILTKTNEAGQVNDFLSNYVTDGDWNGRVEEYPYPLPGESRKIADAFDNLFGTIQEDNNGVLFQIKDKFTPQDEATLKPLIDRLMKKGLASEVVMGEGFDKAVDEILNSESGTETLQTLNEMDSIKQKAIQDGNFMLAPNGKKTNLKENQWLQVRTEAFKNWFGDWENDSENASKVVDENGEPLVVYHGTNIEFNEFKASSKAFSSGANYFTDNKKVATLYGNNIMPVFLNIKQLDEEYDAKGKTFNKWTDEDGGIKINFYALSQSSFVIHNLKDSPNGNSKNIPTSDIYAIGDYNSSQIKSAIYNNGSFDANNADIRMQVLADKYDRSGNEIGDGSYNVQESVYDFNEFPQVKSKVDKSQTTESTYVKYTNEENGKSITVRFSNHENNATKFGDQLNGNTATANEILFHLGLKQRTFEPEKYLSIWNTQVGKKNLSQYEEADKTIQELYAMGANADISKYKGKLAKGSNYLILGDTVNEKIKTKRNILGQDVQIGNFKYSDIQFKKINGTIYGFVKDGKVYLNNQVMNANTPIHEFGHLWSNYAKEEYKEFYKKGTELIKESPYYEQVKNDPNYSYLNEDGIIDEAMAQAIGDNGEANFIDKGVGTKLKSWIKELWNKLGSALGIKGMTPEQIQNLTFKEWVDSAYADMMNGERLSNSKNSIFAEKTLKEKQLDIINESNPMLDDYHTGIRSVADIKTLEEAISDPEWDYDEYNPDYTRKMAENAIKSGKITVYSSYPIKQGVFVSPSKMEAESYSGKGKVYSKEVNPNDIAWIDPTQGQYAKIESKQLPATITIDGVQRPTTNSNGKPIASTEEGVRNFYKWFGDSKVVDNEGRPLVVYHGTDAEFNSFDRSKGKQRINEHRTRVLGEFFTISPDIANVFAEGYFAKWEGVQHGANVIPVYLSITNPQEIGSRDLLFGSEFENENTTIRYRNKLIKQEYDGVLITPESDFSNEGDLSKPQYVVFSPTQIKSATGNDGSFDPSNADIRYQIIGEKGAEALDAAEEATTRLDNLKVAKEMEGKTNPLDTLLNEYLEKGSSLDNEKLMDYYGLKRFTLQNKYGFAVLSLVQAKEYGKGSGTKIMRDLSSWANKNNISIALTPSTSFGATSVNRLKDFYKTFGFEENKGRNKDYSTTESMIRVPKKTKQFTPQEIRLATGWEKGVDGKWRYEVLDGKLNIPEKSNKEIRSTNPSELSPEELTMHKELSGFIGTDAEYEKSMQKKYYSEVYDISDQEYKLSDVFDNQELYKAYPQLKNIKVEFSKQIGFGDGVGGMFDKESNKITVLYNYDSAARKLLDKLDSVNKTIYGLENPTELHNKNAELFGVDMSESLIKAKEEKASIEEKLKSVRPNIIDTAEQTLIHEIQHAIQEIEGFARGGNVEMMNKYVDNNKLDKILEIQKRADEKEQNLEKEKNEKIDDINKFTKKEYDKYRELSMILSVMDKSTGYIDNDRLRYKNGIKVRDIKNLVNKYNNEIKDARNIIKEYNNSINELKKKTESEIYEYIKTNPDVNRYELYKRIAGEVEARNASSRMEMSEEEKRNSLLSETADVAPEDQIILMDNLGISQSVQEKEKPTLSILDAAKNIADKYEKDKQVKVSAKEIYENALEKKINKFTEAYQDSMLGLAEFQKALSEESGKEIKDFENAYIAENQKTSRNTYETEFFNDNYFKPMLESIANLTKKGSTYEQVKRYAFAKHGLERNEVFAIRDAEQNVQEKLAEYNTLLENQVISEEEYNSMVENLNKLKEQLISANRLKDYSGLTSLTESEDKFTEEAQKIVDEFEKGKEAEITDLWNKINTTTKASLKKSYDSGIMTKATYEKVRDMFEFYIPLRGWDDKVASDVYEYLTSERGVSSPSLKSAAGRKSIAEDPFAIILNMGESSINQGNDNVMKQKFLNLVLNHPTSLATVKNMWYENVGTEENPIWEQSMPDIPNNASAEQVQDAIDAHENRMKELKVNGMAKQSATNLKLDYRASRREKSEHSVIVKSAGREYVVYINGNPRAAQAINGLLSNKESDKAIVKAMNSVNRFMAANFTTRNPAFVFSNLSRDLIFGSTAVWIKEDFKYWAKFKKNLATNIKDIMPLLSKFKKGTLDVTIEKERLFKEFLENGGETGYTALHNIDAIKGIVDKELLKAEGKVDIGRAIGYEAFKKSLGLDWGTMQTDNVVAVNTEKAISAFISGIEFMNRSAEDITRFTTFMTSRQMGRSVQRSVFDGKDVTVNFNKKGSGAMGASTFKTFYLFFNAAIQSLNNLASLGKKNPKKLTGALTGFAVMGVLIPMLNEMAQQMFGDGDDEDDYNNLPDWVRKNNLCLWIGKETFITIPLPIELRAFYGMGDIIFQTSNGNMEDKNIALEMVGQIADLMPLNPTDASGEVSLDIKDLFKQYSPDALKPFTQVAINKNYFGMPIYKDWDKTAPGYMKAYKGTSEQLVKSAEFLNNTTGGDAYQRGWIDVNPAIIEHLFESYFGGVGKTVNQTVKTVGMIWDEDSRVIRNVPALNRFVTGSDERNSFSRVRESYNKYKNEAEETGKRERGYKNKTSQGVMEYAEKLSFLNSSKEYQRYLVFKEYKKQLDKLDKQMKEIPDPSGQANLQNIKDITMKELVERLNQIK